jgi:hypothetical protein
MCGAIPRRWFAARIVLAVVLAMAAFAPQRLFAIGPEPDCGRDPIGFWLWCAEYCQENCNGRCQRFGIDCTETQQGCSWTCNPIAG